MDVEKTMTKNEDRAGKSIASTNDARPISLSEIRMKKNTANRNRIDNTVKSIMRSTIEQLRAFGIDPKIGENLEALCAMEALVQDLLRRSMKTASADDDARSKAFASIADLRRSGQANGA
jgi:ribosomal protein S1